MQAAEDVWLHLVGEPFDGGSMTASIHAPDSVGEPAFLLIGLGPLPLREPVPTGIGSFYMSQILQILGVAPIPADGWLHVPFTMPPIDPQLLGFKAPVQAYVPDRLSNPGMLIFDEPYYGWATAEMLVSPTPGQGAAFGDRTASGDLNDDGHTDIVIGAWSEKYQGVFFSGRAYVAWGPDFGSMTPISPPVPKVFGAFAAGFVVADVDGDGVEDLVIGDGVGDPPLPGVPGNLRVYLGGSGFSDTIDFSISSPDGGGIYGQYGRSLAAADFDQDGNLDLAVGLTNADQGPISRAGRLDIYWGPSFLSPEHVWSPDPGEDAFFGSRLISADMNGDGLPDLIEASSRDDHAGTTNSGSVHVLYAPSFATVHTIHNPNPQGFNSRFGSAIATGDMDGDDAIDLVVTDEKGNSYIYWGPSLTSFHRLRRPPQAGGASYGYFAAIGDANGDGQLDIAFSNVFGGPLGGGQVFALLGPYFSTYLHLVDFTGDAGDEFGWSMLFVDLDGDGRQTLLVGSDFADVDGVPGAGKVTLFEP